MISLHLCKDCNCSELQNIKFNPDEVLNNLNLIFTRYWNRKLSKKSYNLDSERYIAKACACLCRQCFH